MRKFLTFLGLLFLLLVGTVVVLLFSPTVHKAVFLWAMDREVEEVSVEKVRLTPSSFRIDGLDLRDQGMHVSTQSAEIKASWINSDMENWFVEKIGCPISMKRE